MAFFIKRNDKINGPFTETQFKSGAASGKLIATDLVSNSKQGPWSSLALALSNSSAQGELDGDAAATPSSAETTFQEPPPIPEIDSKAILPSDVKEPEAPQVDDSSEITRRIKLLQEGRVSYDKRLADRSLAKQERQLLIKSLSNLYRPLGDAVFTAHRENQVPEMATLYPLLGAHAHLQELEAEHIDLQSSQPSGLRQKVKQKAQLLAISVKAKNLTRSLKTLETNIGKELIGDAAIETVRCEATVDILDKFEQWNVEVTKADSRVKSTEVDLESCRLTLQQELNLEAIEGLSSFDNAIRDCEMTLTRGNGQSALKQSAWSLFHRWRNQQTSCRHCHRQRSLWSIKCCTCGCYAFSRKNLAAVILGVIIICFLLAAFSNGTSADLER